MIRTAAARRVLAAGLLLAGTSAGGSAAATAAELEIEGAWHVLVHFRDRRSRHPERILWEDRLWVFERRGDRLVWRDYPIVVFEHAAGRFERSRATGDRFRAEAPWSPDAEQEAEIRAGLRVNPRGARRKRLSRDPRADGWASPAHPRPQSASSVTYHEVARVTGLSGLPVFEWRAVLASARAEPLEGVTRFETREVLDGGRLLRGRYRRDGHLEGTFWLRRAGAPAEARGAARAREARFEARFYGQLADALLSSRRLEAELAAGDARPPDSAAEARIRKLIREILEDELDARGGAPYRYRARLDAIAGELAELLLGERRPLEEVARRLRAGEIAP